MNTIDKIFSKGKGIFAIDESNPSLEKKFNLLNIPITEENKINYRRLLLSQKSITNYISGVILTEDVFINHTIDGEKFTRDYLKKLKIAVGVKIDQGLTPFGPKSKSFITRGVDDVFQKCLKLKDLGADFTKWRSVISVGEEDNLFIKKITSDMAVYAKIVLLNGMTPILEPEVLLKGSHTQEECAKTQTLVLRELVSQLFNSGVHIDKCILKTPFVTNGDENKDEITENDIAEKTVEVLHNAASNFGGVVFLSGGLTPEQSTKYLEKTVKLAREIKLNNITFSFGRALQDAAGIKWAGNPKNETAAKLALSKAFKRNSDVLL